MLQTGSRELQCIDVKLYLLASNMYIAFGRYTELCQMDRFVIYVLEPIEIRDYC